MSSSTPKFRIGDKVKVVRKCSNSACDPYWVNKTYNKDGPNMDDTLGKSYTVISIDKKYVITKFLSIIAYQLNTFPGTYYQYYYAADSLQKAEEQLYLPGMEALANEHQS